MRKSINKWRKYSLAALGSFLCAAPMAHAAGYSEPASYRNPANRETIPKSDVNRTKLQNRIDSLSNRGGGRLTIPRGWYRMRDIQMKSNVHLLVTSGTTFVSDNASSSLNTTTIFNFGGGVRNASIRGVGGKFTIVLKKAGKSSAGTRGIVSNNAYNVLMQDISINSNFTKFSAVEFTWGRVSGGNTGNSGRGPSVKMPRNATLRNVTTWNNTFGYGLIQVTAGDRLLFENMKCTGGVNLRLETHWLTMQRSRTGGTGSITARNLSQSKGQSAVKLQPHTMRNGWVTLDKVFSSNAGSTVSNESGFVSSEFSQSERDSGRFTPGNFGRVTVSGIRGVRNANQAEYSFAQIRRLRQSDHRSVCRIKSDGLTRMRGPSAGVVFDTARPRIVFRGARPTGSGYGSIPLVQSNGRNFNGTLPTFPNCN